MINLLRFISLAGYIQRPNDRANQFRFLPPRSSSRRRTVFDGYKWISCVIAPSIHVLILNIVDSAATNRNRTREQVQVTNNNIVLIWIDVRRAEEKKLTKKKKIFFFVYIGNWAYFLSARRCFSKSLSLSFGAGFFQLVWFGHTADSIKAFFRIIAKCGAGVG